MHKNLKILTINAVLAACYVVITALFASFSFGVIQVRVSTALYQLVAYDKKFYWGNGFRGCSCKPAFQSIRAA
nr:QueT transporter family protein [Liquorilactobacillus satsumensis]